MPRTRLWYAVSLCLLLPLLGGALPAEGPALRVEESRVELVATKGGQAAVALALVNASGTELAARVEVEIVDTRDRVVTRADADEIVRRGDARVVVPLGLTFERLTRQRRDLFPWYRLRYRVEPRDSGVAPVAGIVSVSEIVPDLFELHVLTARVAREGEPLRARVSAVHPVTRRPIAGVQVEGEIPEDPDEEDQDKQAVLHARAVTDSEGRAALDFKIPRRVEDEDFELNVSARRGVVEDSASTSVTLERRARILLTTDKPLYQPGQTLHVRALVFDSNRRAAADTSVAFEIEDPEGTTAFRADAKTSRFGVASADWDIPAGTRLGDYAVNVKLDEDVFGEESHAGQKVKISRYELPNFSVAAKSDRTFYLAGQNAEVEVRADYLFGQPVKRGRVRVVRETEREWDFEEQKYETKEGPEVTGELDAAGRFLARLDLTDEYKKLAEDGWERMRDIGYAAYVTDASTNRTEQRRFTLRLTKDQIHVYVTVGNFGLAEGLPLAFYVSTFYADGEPAECDVTVTERPSDDDDDDDGDAKKPPAKSPARELLRVRTNRYGVARAVGPVARLRPEQGQSLALAFSARDAQGRTGSFKDSFWLDDEARLRVETDKTLYRAGEPVRVRVTSNRPDLMVFVDATSEWHVLASAAVRLKGGRAELTLPYGEGFKDAVTVSAVSTDIPRDSGYNNYTSAVRTVVYPRNRELKLDVKTERTVYRPGEDAEAAFTVRGADGRRVEGALGVVVFDKAVEERARTDADFSFNAYGFGGAFYDYLYGGMSLGSVSRRDIEQLDLSKRVPAGLELAAEMLFNASGGDYYPRVFDGAGYDTNLGRVFRELITARLKPLKSALAARYEKTFEYPSDEASLRRILEGEGLDFDSLRDPWGTSFRPAFGVDRASDVLTLKSAGADKRFDTADDFDAVAFEWPYFRATGETISRAVSDYHRRTGGHVRDAATLKAELLRLGLDLDALRDRWGRPYALDFGLSGTNYTLNVRSGGPDGRLNPESVAGGDDFVIWTALSDYFAETRQAVDSALSAHTRATGHFPQTDAEFAAALARATIDLASLRDGWGRALRTAYRSEQRYVDRVRVENRGRYNESTLRQETRQHTEIKPVTQTVYFVTLQSSGPDARFDTYDDFNAAVYTSVAAEQSAQDAAPRPVLMKVVNLVGTGAVSGKVVDPQGASVPNATVTLTHKFAEFTLTTTTDDEGVYLFRNLPSGLYNLRVEAAGFRAAVIDDVQVQSSNLTKVDVMVDVGGVTETVEITSTQELSHTVDFSVGQKRTNLTGETGTAARQQLSTPRLRERFEETLLWQPLVETDRQGRARLNFKLADNITTWVMSVIGSTADGELGTAQREIRAFQPFFVEHDPPQVLTEGDEIALPVVLRNYLERAQGVELSIKPEPWFALTGPAGKRAEVPAGDSSRETFDFRATASVDAGKQRITAVGPDASDAIEKPVRVHPDGEELAQTVADLFTGAGALETEVPDYAVPGSVRAELKIYPNLGAHLLEGIEGILERPHGCGEQTISSTYPSVMLLRRHKALAGPERKELQPTLERARRYARLGYERLLNYRDESGGFTYWGRDDNPDLALTAYALRFLSDARDVMEVDEDVIARARTWLASQQREDGSWPARFWDGKEDTRRTALTTAYVARVLASDARRSTPTNSGDALGTKSAAEALTRALRYLARRAEEIDEPYLIASYALASADAGRREEVARAAARLRSLALDEGPATYWSLETNTPFYGWGLAGRIETTALVVQALAADCGLRAGGCGLENQPATAGSTPGSADPQPATRNPQPVSPQLNNQQLITRGVLFLLHSKDRYGVWLSTQATVNVLDAMLTLLAPGSTKSPADAASQTVVTAEVFVNGRPAGTLTLPPPGQLAGPVTLELSRHLTTGANRVEIRRAPAFVQAQLVTTFYVPWSHSTAAAAGGQALRRNNASALRLAVRFDRERAEVGQEISCRVEAERVAHSGYGMLLAEVGLPPGADVDRASLERAMQESGYSLSRYDLLPDRLVLYLWPASGGTSFDFKFKPRYGINALTAPSQIYDYYNPEARAVVAPTRFVVR